MLHDTKAAIAKAIETLLIEKKVKKLTVKDIVKECKITRQAFYYHFTDIPDLLQWIMQKKTEEVITDSKNFDNIEDQIRYWLLIGINVKSYIKKGLQTNYADEMGQICFSQMKEVFTVVTEKDKVFQGLTQSEKDLLIRYNCYAMFGLMRDWSENDTENLDIIVHSIYLFVTGQVVSHKM